MDVELTGALFATGCYEPFLESFHPDNLLTKFATLFPVYKSPFEW
jgi:hypothetical protein